MDEYPRTLAELEAQFSTEDACREYLFRLRWPEGFACPRCGHTEAWEMKSGLFRCARCKHKASVTAGTIFQDTRQPLRLWFRAIWWVVSQKNGASALGVKRILGLRSYETAWTWLHKLRRAMVRPGRDRLSGRVEVDESFVGGEEEGVHGRETERKALVVIAAQENGAGIGRIRMRRVPDASRRSLVPFVQEAVEPGATLLTDGWDGYAPLESMGYTHKAIRLRKSGKNASELMPRVHRVASLLKRWLMGTHQGAVSREHLPYYLDEFTFRFNRRGSRHRGLLFYRLLQHAALVGPVSYEGMILHVPGRGRRRGDPRYRG